MRQGGLRRRDARAVAVEPGIHLAVAIRLGVDELISYDAELSAVAARAGLAILAPG